MRQCGQMMKRRCTLYWEFTADRPIYAQLIELIQKRIFSGIYPLGSSMPSVRMLASEASVNPNTMQRALAELEGQGLLYTQRTSGRTVTTDERLIMQVKERVASEYIERYFEGMLSLGIIREDAAKMLAAQAKSTRVSPGGGAGKKTGRMDVGATGAAPAVAATAGAAQAGAAQANIDTANTTIVDTSGTQTEVN